MYGVVDLYGTVTGVSLCSPVSDFSQSGTATLSHVTATLSHSLTSALMAADVTSADVSCQPAETDGVTAASAVLASVVCLSLLIEVQF